MFVSKQEKQRYAKICRAVWKFQTEIAALPWLRNPRKFELSLLSGFELTSTEYRKTLKIFSTGGIN